MVSPASKENFESSFSHDEAHIKAAFMQGIQLMYINLKLFEPRREKTGLRGFRPGQTQTGLYSYRRWLEA